MTTKTTVWRNPLTGRHVQVHNYSVKGERRIGETLRDRDNANGVPGRQFVTKDMDVAQQSYDKLNAIYETAGYERIESESGTGQRGRSNRVENMDAFTVPAIVKPVKATDAPKPTK